MQDLKYGKVTLEKKPNAPADEPCFVIRAQDELATRALNYYAQLYMQETGDSAGWMQIQRQIKNMAAWPTKKKPD